MSIDTKQLASLIKRVSTDQKLQLTEDTSLLSEERYPLELSPLFESLTKPTSLQDAMNLLQWDRTKASGYLDRGALEQAKVQQNSLRKALQLTPDTDSPWEKVQYQDWKDKITVIVLSAVQKVAIAGVKSDNPLHWIYSPKLVDPTKTIRRQDDNIEGLQYLHPLLLDSPWEEPSKLDDLLIRLCSERDPITYGQATSKSQIERIKAKQKLRASILSMKQALRRIYKLNSDTFHAFLVDLIPRARENKSHLFTRVKAEREQHLVRQRAYKSQLGTSPALPPRQAQAHSALHTLDFIEQHYVRDNENSVHILWTHILLHTREPMVNVYNWVVSFELPVRRITQCQGTALDKAQTSRLRQLIAKQITDAEKLTITTINTSLTADLIDAGTYDLNDLKTLLATHIARFDLSYSPQASTRIMRYLRTRAKDFKVELPSFSKPKGKGRVKGKFSSPAHVKRAHGGTQRSWNASEQHIQTYTPCTNQHCIDMNTAHTHSIDTCRSKFSRLGSFGKGKGKGGHKGKGKGKDSKGRGKGSKGMLKGKGVRKGFKGGAPSSKGASIMQLPAQTQGSSSAPSANAAEVTCYFCHQKGHYKSQCPKWLALRSSSAYQQTRQQAPRLGMIFDHLEDSVFAPDFCCLWCADTTCDGTNCSSTFDPNDFHEATTFFMQQLQPLVANAKLDRPLDSHPPLSRELMLTRLEADDWGDAADGAQYEQDDYWSAEHDDESYYHDYLGSNPEEQEEYQGEDQEEQMHPEQSNEPRHTQEGITGESEDDYQEE